MDSERKRKELRKQVKKHKNRPEVWVDYAMFELEQGDMVLAERLLKKALQLSDMTSTDALYVLGLVYIQKDDRERALKVLKKAERLAPDVVEISLTIGSILIELRNVVEGETHARALTEEHPADPQVWNYLAIMLDLSGDHAGAEQAIRMSLFNDDSLANTWLTLGVVLEGQTRFAGAEEAYKRAVYIEPENLQLRKCLEQLYLKMGREEDAGLVWHQDLGYFYKNLPHEERVRYDEYMKIGDDTLKGFLEEHYGILDREMEKVDFEA